MNVVLVIPARMKASRLPGKPMKPILGIPLIEHCYHRACKAVGSEAVYIATCDQEIESHANGLGGQVIMTSADHTRATTRTAEAAEDTKHSESLMSGTEAHRIEAPTAHVADARLHGRVCRPILG